MRIYHASLCATVLAVLILTTGCSHRQDPIAHPSPTGAAVAGCRAVMADLPQTVAGARLDDHDATVATWGDPRIVLRCGVNKPADLQLTSRCDVVNDVGWFSEQIDDGWRFTTIGRAGYVEVTVPTSYAPQADALVDLSTTIKKMPLERPCQ
ncbi:DUF3515 domain-containing protein [Cutibacterium sp. WCA-380-WT-3A]|uniref:DUF3515 domain-containing protein n=1 Tax=Cutibacterium porci TaxID=2605781 RepID=A0A7K0J5R3_9ACTN|nr:DUF3515 domain-containing protein [Cutibacterium porci]MSS45257.1 DUF3515 domain-containing protein [Cutibacterium porci]